MRLVRILILPVLLVVACVLTRLSMISIGPDEIGVRTLNFGSEHGIVQQDYGPGYHRNLWPLDTWNRFPSTVQHIRFASDESSSLIEANRPFGDIQLTSADGDRVSMTLEVAFRIADGRAYYVLQDSGADQRYEDVVRNLSQDAIRVLFGRLRTEAFYNQASREKVRNEATEILKGRLAQRGIELVDVLLQNIKFDQNYEKLIRQKKVNDQKVELQKALAKAAEETGKVSKITAETKVKVDKVAKETEATVTTQKTETDLKVAALAGEAGRYAAGKAADGQLYDSEKRAEGEKLVKFATAEGTLRLNVALAGDGGRNLVALEAAKALNLLEVTFPSFGYEWFNPHEMARRLGASEPTNLTPSPTTQPSLTASAAR